MCRYRYHYFAGCRHSETALVSFCEKAQAATRAGRQVAAASEPETLPALAPETSSFYSQHSAASIRAHPFHSSHEADLPEGDMAGFPALSGSTFRKFMTSSLPAQQHAAEKQSATPSLQPLRARQAGIREHTDESCDLPTSNDILQHLVESYPQQGSALAGLGASEDLDHLEAEIDQLKNDVSRLREEAEQGHSTASSVSEQDFGTALTSPQRSALSARSEKEELSAATRLQRMHEEAEQEALTAKSRPPQAPPQPPPPSPMDFPVFGSPAASSSTQADTPTNVRRPSYADAAMSALPRKNAQTAMTPRSSLASGEAADKDTVVDVPQAEDKATSGEKAKTIKQAPHFAQPTQSYARRAGETLRKEAGMSPQKKAIEVASSPSIKGKDSSLAADTRVATRRRKHKSLPRGWMNDDLAGASPMADDATGPSDAESAVQKASPTRTMAHAAAPAVNTAPLSPTKIPQPRQSPRLQKKTSSYMAPTSATTQRTAATLSKDRPKRDSPGPKRRPPKLDISPSKHFTAALSPDLGTAGSDTSSVQFIMDRPTALVTSPISRAASPLARYLEEQQAGRSSPTFSLPRSSPSRATRKSRMIEHFSSSAASTDHHAAQPVPSPNYKTLHSMPSVANTTTVRRTSNQQILRPILARLSAQGLARESPFSARSPADTAASLSRPLSPEQEISRSNAGASSTSSDALAHSFTFEAWPSSEQIQQDAERLSSRHFGLQLDIGSATLAPSQTATPARTSSYSTLRATAREFTPMQQAVMPAVEPYIQAFEDQERGNARPYTLEELTAFRPAEEWLHMPVGTKKMINNLRAMSTRQQTQGRLSVNQQGSHTAHGRPSPNYASVNERGSPQTSQLSEPSTQANTLPVKKAIHWSMERSDGGPPPRKFGRAPALSVLFGPEGSPHPTISPTSDGTSPLKTPRSASGRPWSIGSAASVMPYGWTGGDGKEIRFVGYGPHAERDPNSAVRFDFQGSEISISTLGPQHRQDAEGKENVVSETVAPRSQKQWAEKVGLDHVPCDSVMIDAALESVPVPFSGQVAGYCHDCYGGR